MKDLNEAGVFLLHGEINNKICQEAVEFIKQHNIADNKLDYITIEISSYGGGVKPMFALVDAMKLSSIPVRTFATGAVASAGLGIAMAGAKGHRTISESCAVMAHEHSSGTGGGFSDMQAHMVGDEQLDLVLVNHMAKCTGKSKAYVRKHLMNGKDVWMTPLQGLAHNLFDKIVKVY